jgi:ferredoxin
MTPFGIRRRLKSMIGLGGKPPVKREEKPKFSITVIGPAERRQSAEVPVGQTVLLSAGSLGAPIASGCSDSSCSTCRFEVLSGDDLLTPRNDLEVATLKANARDAHLRLGCQATVQRQGNLEVRAFEFLE